MENKKSVLITIIVLLVIFIPLTILGYFNRSESKKNENPNHELYYQGYLWFYNASNELIYKYQCQTETCGLAKGSIDDDSFGIYYYKDGNIENIPLINDRFAFILDGEYIYLYNIETDLKLSTLKAVKNYNTIIENNTYLMQNHDGLWGVFSLNENIEQILPYEYDFIGLPNRLNYENNLSTESFIAFKNPAWFIVVNIGSNLTTAYNYPIIDYSYNYVVCKEAETSKIHIYDYEGNEYLKEVNIKKHIFESNYTGIIVDNVLYIYNNLAEDYLKIISVPEGGNVTMETAEDIINIKINGEIVETLEITG